MRRDGAEAALRLIARSLTPQSIALVSFQGRHSDHIQKHKWKYPDDRRYARAEREMRRRGFGYVDYEGSFRSILHAQARYRVALVRPHWVMKTIGGREDVTVINDVERT